MPARNAPSNRAGHARGHPSRRPHCLLEEQGVSPASFWSIQHVGWPIVLNGPFSTDFQARYGPFCTMNPRTCKKDHLGHSKAALQWADKSERRGERLSMRHRGGTEPFRPRGTSDDSHVREKLLVLRQVELHAQLQNKQSSPVHTHPYKQEWRRA